MLEKIEVKTPYIVIELDDVATREQAGEIFDSVCEAAYEIAEELGVDIFAAATLGPHQSDCYLLKNESELTKDSITFNSFQEEIKISDLFEKEEHSSEHVNSAAWTDKILGLAGEAGEVADKFKKIIRDKDGYISEEDRVEILKEIGDVLWYAATICRYMGKDFSEAAQSNLDKMHDRMERGVLNGSGDNR
jgi:NTP pyrophosphatase (non-canonical NTP hydrolase)